LKGRTVIALVAVLAVVGAGCTDAAETTTTTASVAPGEDIVFGDGVLPDTIPDGFPLPNGSAIGSTMVVGQTGFTEVVVRVSAEQGITAEFFSQGLNQNGFTVDRSEAEGENWVIEFSTDTSKGTIDVSEPVEGISQAIVRYNLP
jgi:hypothetical protein